MAKVFARRANFKLLLSRLSRISPHMKALLDIIDAARHSDWDEEVDEEEANHPDFVEASDDTQERAHIRHRGVIFSREQSHVGNSIIAYEKSPRSTSTSYGTIETIKTIIKTVESREAVIAVSIRVKPYLPLPAGFDNCFSRYAPHFPTQLVSNERGELEEIPISSIKCHCARYQASRHSMLMVELSRVSC
jgi:hypothetical protein